MTDHRAGQPFRFFSCMELREVLGRRAMDEQQLLDSVEEAPAESIYYHTHSYYIRHAYHQEQGLFPNDFATWVAIHVQDRMLAERLGMIDALAFDDVEEIRGEIVSIISDHLSHRNSVPRSSSEEPFEFVRAHIIETDMSLEAWTLREFREAFALVEVGAIYYHLCEARLRKGRENGDVAHWLAAREGLGRPDLATAVGKVMHRGLSLEGMRERIVRLCDQALQTT